MAQNRAILFDFADSWSAALACDTLQQLGYEPILHEGNRVHIHLNSDDIASALEVIQAHGGQMTEQSDIGGYAIADTAYALDAIPIPAHLVNEDWVEEPGGPEEPAGLRNRDEDADTGDEFLPDSGTYGYFSGDVRI